jgi:hypothetical protein
MNDHRSYCGLVLCGDWALAHGNVGSLAEIAEELAERAQGGLRGDLVEVARLCRTDEVRASRQWFQLRSRLAAEGAFVTSSAARRAMHSIV